MIVFTSYFDSLVLSTLTEHLSSGGFTGPLNNLTLILLQQAVQLNPQTGYAQLVECTFSGYSRVTGLVWGAPCCSRTEPIRLPPQWKLSSRPR